MQFQIHLLFVWVLALHQPWSKSIVFSADVSGSLFPALLLDYSSHMTRGLSMGKQKKYLEAHSHFARASLLATNKRQKQKALTNEALALFRMGKQWIMKNADSPAALETLTEAEERFKTLRILHPGRSTLFEKHIEKIEKLKKKTQAPILAVAPNHTSVEEQLDTFERSRRTDHQKMKRPTRHTQTHKDIERVLFADIVKNGDSLPHYLEKRTEPVIIEHGPSEDWQFYTNMSWSYLKESLPEKLEVVVQKSQFNLYTNKNKHSDVKYWSPQQFLESLLKFHVGDAVGGETYNDPNKLYPYLSLEFFGDKALQGQGGLDLKKAGHCNILHDAQGKCGGRMQTILWAGAKNVTAITHFDHNVNSYLMLLGRKHFLMVSPKYFSSLYIHPAPGMHHRQSQVTDLYNVDSKKFPKFKDVRFQEGVLNPGEMIYIPPLWFHNIRSLEASAAISFWSHPPTIAGPLSAFTSAPTGLDDARQLSPYDFGRILNRDAIIEFVMELFGRDRNQAITFIRDDILNSKYMVGSNMEDQHCPREESMECPPSELSFALLPAVTRAIKTFAKERADLILKTPLNKTGGLIMLSPASVEIMVHHAVHNAMQKDQNQPSGSFGHGDKASRYVCQFLMKCILDPMLNKSHDIDGPTQHERGEL